MYITAKYILTLESSGEYLCKNLEKPICPCCGTKLKYRDTRRRIMKKEGGVVIFLMLRRLFCRKCRRLHIELPACLSPYKHYDVEVIEGVIDGIVTEDDLDSENYPCAATMERWREWLNSKSAAIDQMLRSIRQVLQEMGYDLPLRKKYTFEQFRKDFFDEVYHWLGILNYAKYRYPYTPNSP